MGSSNRSEEVSLRRYMVRIQKRRILVYVIATIVGITAKLLGVFSPSWLGVGAFIGVIIGTALAFGLWSARGPVGKRGMVVHALWIGIDVMIITWMIHVTGGSQSTWFPWYLAPIAAAGYIMGPRAILIVMAASFAAYVGMIAVSEPGGAASARAVTNGLMLFGAALNAVLLISTLQGKRRTIAGLRDLEARRAADLEKLAATLTERSRELDIANERLRLASITDHLTGLHNRRFLEEEIPATIAQTRRSQDDRRAGRVPATSNSDLGFLMLDIDNFKRTNDAYGHEAGDRLLTWLAAALKRSARGTDSIIRWGGDEFLVVARQTNHAHLLALALRLRSTIGAEPFEVRPGLSIGVSCSIGFSYYPFDEHYLFSWSEVVGLADEALMHAKRSGRNLAIGVEPGDRPLEPGGPLETLRDFQAAVGDGRLRLVMASVP